MDHLKIRSMRRADLPEVLTMVQALARHHHDTPTATVDTLVRDLFGRDRWIKGLVAQHGSGLWGYALLSPLIRAQFGQRGLDLHHLFVVDHARGQGIGRALTSAARHLAERAGAAYLTVGTHPENHAAVGFYLSSGFNPMPMAGLRFSMPTEPPKLD